MKLFTLVLDYCGGTYVSQANCGTLTELGSILYRAIDWNALSDHLSEKEKHQFLEDLMEIAPTPIDGLTNVWCSSARLGKAMAIVHIIETTGRGIDEGKQCPRPCA
jgi:hypothetical protein